MPNFTPTLNVAGVVEEVADHLKASMEHVQQQEWLIQQFGARQYVEEHRFLNSDQVSLHEAYDGHICLGCRANFSSVTPAV